MAHIIMVYSRKDENLMDMGIRLAYAYFCYRCEYFWFPKDFDPEVENIEDRPLLKGCARCKSKYWNQLPITERGHDSMGDSIARFRATNRKFGLSEDGFKIKK